MILYEKYQFPAEMKMFDPDYILPEIEKKNKTIQHIWCYDVDVTYVNWTKN